MAIIWGGLGAHFLGWEIIQNDNLIGTMFVALAAINLLAAFPRMLRA